MSAGRFLNLPPTREAPDLVCIAYARIKESQPVATGWDFPAEPWQFWNVAAAKNTSVI